MPFCSSPRHNGSADRRGLFARLLRDRSANTSVIIAAAMVPLAGVIGGGVDMGRAYMAKSKLQTACDAGALAARREMSTKPWGADTLSAANSYFTANFNAGQYGVTNIVHNFSAPSEEEVTGTATADVPTTVMKIFTFTTIPVQVHCRAVMNLPNSDIMFVLDTTGSMADKAVSSDPNTKITTLRTAVKDFHATIEAAKSASTQVRYGFVPYSTTVNVGFLLKPEWMVDNWTYQSRVPDGTDSDPGGVEYQGEFYSDWTQVSGASSRVSTTNNLPLESCVQPDDAMTWGPTTVLTHTEVPYAGPPAGTLITETRQYTADGVRYWISQTSTTCTLTTETFTGFVESYKSEKHPAFTDPSTTYWWQYRPVSVDVTPLKGMTPGLSVTLPIGYQHANRQVFWSGCIEERNTVRATDYSTIPGGALDMNIDLVPSSGNPATQWRPALPQVVFARQGFNSSWQTSNFRYQWDTTNVGDYGGGAWAPCPSASRKLATMSSSDVANYVDGLVTTGDTYHDIGMVWGARLLSGSGLFAAENNTSPNGGNIMRHLIFMTDGETNTDPRTYDAYGWPALDRRRVMDDTVDPTRSDQNTLVENRLLALCEAVKGKNITVWVIAFGTALTSDLTTCATSAEHAKHAADAAELSTAFNEIAGSIANLRLND